MDSAEGSRGRFPRKVPNCFTYKTIFFVPWKVPAEGSRKVPGRFPEGSADGSRGRFPQEVPAEGNCRRDADSAEGSHGRFPRKVFAESSRGRFPRKVPGRFPEGSTKVFRGRFKDSFIGKS